MASVLVQSTPNPQDYVLLHTHTHTLKHTHTHSFLFPEMVRSGVWQSLELITGHQPKKRQHFHPASLHRGHAKSRINDRRLTTRKEFKNG